MRAIAIRDLASAARRELGLGRLARAATERVEPDDLRTGRWFSRALAGVVAHHGAAQSGAPRATPASTASDAARAIRRRACAEALVTGAAAAGSTTAATVVSAETEGLGGLVAIPLAAIAVVLEMLARSAIQVRMTCELGEVFGVRFDPDEPDELTRLFSLALGTMSGDAQGDRDRSVIERALSTDAKHAGRAIGGALLGESVIRNVVPFVGIVASAAQNARLTAKLGATVERYLGYRAALGAIHDRLAAHHADALPLFTEGVFHVFAADGRLEPAEVAILAHLVRTSATGATREITSAFVGDEAGWIQRLGAVDDGEARQLVMQGVRIAAALGAPVPAPTRAVVERAAAATHAPVGDLDALARDLASRGPRAVVDDSVPQSAVPLRAAA
jgi:uncharacterized protein (DUF697 family)